MNGRIIPARVFNPRKQKKHKRRKRGPNAGFSRLLKKTRFLQNSPAGAIYPSPGCNPGNLIKKFHERCKRGINAGIRPPFQGLMYFHTGYPGLHPGLG